MLERYREKRRRAIKAYAGSHWGSEANDSLPRPVNLLALYAGVVGRQLVSKSPRALLTTFDRAAEPHVKAMQSWMNKEVVAINLAETLQRAVFDALFCLGVVKVGLATPEDSASAGWNQPAGLPFACRVDLDDLVFDRHCRDLRQAGFVGHRYRVPLEVARQSGRLKKNVLKDAVPSEDGEYDESGQQRVNILGRGTEGEYGDDEHEEHVDLWEVYVARHRLVYTFLGDGEGPPVEGAEPLAVTDWVGPEAGPYHFLGLGWVPDNAMPKAPVMDLVDLDAVVNRLWRKLILQADRQKDVAAVKSGASEDGQRIVEAADGDAIKCDDPASTQIISLPGPNAQNFAFATAARDVFSWLAGNLDTMAGLAAQAKTARQEAMLNENASRLIIDYQETAVTFVSDVMRSLGWYWWHDPFRTVENVWTPQGLPHVRQIQKVSPEQRASIPWDALEFKLDPYSVAPTTPQQRGAALDQVVTQIIVPLLPVLAQQGVQFDLPKYLEYRSEYLNLPELPSIVAVGEPAPPPGGAPEGPGKPGSTERRYVRENVSEKTRTGQDQTTARELMAGRAESAIPTPE
jgi:hypothetical protein